ncbi:MAG TPA: Uma2 family endonuclease [Bryobacteraceae bacterium]|jgi:Uma2 family endonuclease|nr:Uma2 family endonuclease [Bryobacteraceae bacterium]
MAAAISVTEYLNTCYRPDCDYVDGQVLERNLGEYEHSRPQALVAALLFNQEKQRRIVVLIAQRIQVGPNRFRVADVCVLRADAPYEPIVRTPPLICIEVVARNDSFMLLLQRLDDYRAMGVENIWVVDPHKRRGYRYTSEGLLEAKDGILRTSNPDLAVPLNALFD